MLCVSLSQRDEDRDATMTRGGTLTLQPFTFEVHILLNGTTLSISGGGECKVEALGLVDPHCRTGSHIRPPPSNWQPLPAVPDEIAAVWREGSSPPIFSKHPVSIDLASSSVPRPGCIVLLVESPHKDEFDMNGTPRGPLKRKVTRQYIHAHLGNLIVTASQLLQISIEDRDIVFANPVQFQASLHSFMANRTTKLQGWLRDSVWRAMFDNPTVRADFDSRMRAYAPALVLAAPTCGLILPVLDALSRLSTCVDHFVAVSPHPCAWRNSHCLRVYLPQ